MESAMFAGLLLHPYAIAIALAVVVVASVASYYLIPSAMLIAPMRLVGGYLGALVVITAICAAISYVSPYEAETVWKVPPENYWSALGRQFLTSFVIFCYAAILGIAVVGAPAIFLLNWKRRATIPWVIGVSVLISLLAVVLLETFLAPSRNVLQTIGFITGAHVLLALGFCIGARLPWRSSGAAA